MTSNRSFQVRHAFESLRKVSRHKIRIRAYVKIAKPKAKDNIVGARRDVFVRVYVMMYNMRRFAIKSQVGCDIQIHVNDIFCNILP